MSLPNHIRHRTVFSMRPLVLETTNHEMPTRVGDVTFEVVGAMQFERQHTLRTAMDGGGKAQESFMQAAQQEHALNEQQCVRQVGQACVYGQVYQLRHVETDSWLCVESVSVVEQSHALPVVLVNKEHSSHHCQFRFASAFRPVHPG